MRDLGRSACEIAADCTINRWRCGAADSRRCRARSLHRTGKTIDGAARRAGMAGACHSQPRYRQHQGRATTATPRSRSWRAALVYRARIDSGGGHRTVGTRHGIARRTASPDHHDACLGRNDLRVHRRSAGNFPAVRHIDTTTTHSVCSVLNSKRKIMSLDDPEEQALLEYLSRYKPPAGIADPRVAFYEMGHAAAMSHNGTAERTKRETAGWVAMAATIAACVSASFFAGYVVRPIPSRAISDVAEVRQPSSATNRSDVSELAAAPAILPVVAQSQPVSVSHSSLLPRSAVLLAGSQDSWGSRNLNAYGLSAARPIHRNETASAGNGETLVSTLSRLDYLTWEDLQ